MENKYKKKYIFERVFMVGIFVYKLGVFNLFYDINGIFSCRNIFFKIYSCDIFNG